MVYYKQALSPWIREGGGMGRGGESSQAQKAERSNNNGYLLKYTCNQFRYAEYRPVGHLPYSVSKITTSFFTVESLSLSLSIYIDQIRQF